MSDLTGERNVILGGLAMGMSRERGQGALPGHRRLLRHQREGRLHLPADADVLLRHGGPAALLHRRGQEPRRPHDRRGAGHRRPSFQKRSPRSASANCARRPARSSWSATTTSRSRDTCDRVLWLERANCGWTGRPRRSWRRTRSSPAKSVRPPPLTQGRAHGQPRPSCARDVDQRKPAAAGAPGRPGLDMPLTGRVSSFRLDVRTQQRPHRPHGHRQIRQVEGLRALDLLQRGARPAAGSPRSSPPTP